MDNQKDNDVDVDVELESGNDNDNDLERYESNNNGRPIKSDLKEEIPLRRLFRQIRAMFTLLPDISVHLELVIMFMHISRFRWTILHY